MNLLHKQTNPCPKKRKVTKLGWRKSLGQIGEQHAVDFLLKKGWRIIERNWRAGRFAEIDIIACDPKNILVFLEVKTRIQNDQAYGFIDAGFDKIDRRKIAKMEAVARLYMAKCLTKSGTSDIGCRFDALILYYPASVRRTEWERFDAFHKLHSVKPEVLHVQDLFG
jgi:putative endonuclease